MAKFTKTFPVTVEFYWSPEERATMTEEGCPEEFDLLSFKIGDEEILQLTNNSAWNKIEEIVYDYLKEDADAF